MHEAVKNPGPSKHPSKHFTEVIRMARKRLKRGSTLLDIREMQIKSTVSCSEHPPEWLRKREKKRKQDNTKTWQERRAIATPAYRLWECKLVRPRWKTVWRYLLVSPANSPSSPPSKNTYICSLKDMGNIWEMNGSQEMLAE